MQDRLLGYFVRCAYFYSNSIKYRERVVSGLILFYYFQKLQCHLWSYNPKEPAEHTSDLNLA